MSPSASKHVNESCILSISSKKYRSVGAITKLVYVTCAIYVLLLQQVNAQRKDYEKRAMSVFIPEDETDLRDCEVITPSYSIEKKRFYEMIDKRCGASTILKNPVVFEPTFLFVNNDSNVIISATAPASEILQAGFDPNKKTLFLIHGYTQSYDSYAAPWLFEARQQYLNNNLQEHYNFFIMDWGKAAAGNYFAAAARVNGMGSFLTNFLSKLINQLGADRMDIHLIGFSLGAHVAGFAGKRTKPNIGRITGIDPAGPCFGKILQMTDYERLSSEDAYLVDTWHTDSGLFGRHGIQGQFDIFINGGAQQPDCGDNLRVIFEGLITAATNRNRSISPSHTRACQIAVDPVWKTACQHVAYECPTYTGFKRGECGDCDEMNSQCYFMGLPFQYQHPIPNFNTPLRTTGGKSRKRLFILTGSEGHLCLMHTQIVINLVPLGPTSKYERKNYSFILELENQDHAKAKILVNNKKSAGVYTYLLLTEGQPQRIARARLQFKDQRDHIVPITQLPSPVLDIKVNFMSNSDYLIRQALSSRLCPKSIEAGNWIGFELC